MKLLKKDFTSIILSILILLVPFYSNAQNNIERCGTDERMQKQLEDPEFAAKYDELKARVAQKTRNNKRLAPCTNPLVVPIVVHFQSNSISDQCMTDASLAQVEQLNRDFASCNKNADKLCEWIEADCVDFGGVARADAMPDDGACIQFCLADQNLPADTNLASGGFAITTGYDADEQNAPPIWNKYLNVYITDDEELLGFVFFLGGAADTNIALGATVTAFSFGANNFSGCEGVGTNTTFGGGTTLTHEIGHWFGLEHTFEDILADTPPQSIPNFGCPSVNANTCATDAIDGYSGNFMDYSDDECLFNFSQDQIDIMLATAADQSEWATNSISCSPTYPPCDEANQAGACMKVCPSSIITQISLSEDACGETSLTAFPDGYDAGLRANENTDLKFTWSTGNYLSAGGTLVSVPTIQKANGCDIQTETYYLNVDCGTTPLNKTLDGGTYVLRAYPNVPDDVIPLINITGENLCDEPTVVPIAGCEPYLDIVANSANPSFPVSSSNLGTVTYNVTFIPNPEGPDCCEEATNMVVIGGAVNDGDLEVLGVGGDSPWTSTSTIFEGVICSAAFCGGGEGISYGDPPNSGDFLAWFGGVDEFEEGTVEGNFIIPSCPNGQTTFSFAFENAPCINENDLIQLQVDGNVVWSNSCDSTDELQLITLDFSEYANDESHYLLFKSTKAEGSATSFTIDNIQLLNEGCNADIVCKYTLEASYNCEANDDCNLPDWAALKALYQSTDGDNWQRNHGWEQVTSDVPPAGCSLSDLYGVTFDDNGRVTAINLYNNGLNGALPPKIGDLSELTALYLSSVNLAGEIPVEIAKLSKLEYLFLVSSGITGAIPAELGQLNNLKDLRLSYNELSGEIPVELTNLPNLTYLSLSNNQLSGSIPPELANLANLRWLSLSNNQLTGSIPAELSALTSLRLLTLDHNNLSGCYPPALSTLCDQLIYNFFGEEDDISSNNNLDASWEKRFINVYNIAGKTTSFKLVTSGNNTKLDLNYLPKGIYIVEVDNGFNSKTQKLMIQ